MIRNRLKELLAERNLRISRVAADIPNLSRNTITTTSQNEGKMLQLETINTLCQYLNIEPNDFFEYLPFDVEAVVSTDHETVFDGLKDYNKNAYSVSAKIYPFDFDLYLFKKRINESSGSIKKTFDLVVRLDHEVELSSKHPNIIKFEVLLGHADDKKSYEKQKDEFYDFWNKQLTPGFQQFVKKEIMEQCHDTFSKYVKKQLDTFFEFKFRKLQFTFTFEDAFLNKDFSTPRIRLQSEDLPF
ncbi:helix-turn-helix domain-containing protein [Liquorilactobacillus oeni]|uniref:HTH cro/C1-type domain-containing protein n=1 Tax=Liquorilactobacillus oeni DSM 19972 TaxID=1423777 RepID=A0A0R1MMV9_9LACO|nr:helix-turn-helix transcriptional regulator [Liquorilactobacillus oeni]KRL05851.1 hypothetical protein FD46_GL000610 [Liquorilactobacillus oeni DSM 19972]